MLASEFVINEDTKAKHVCNFMDSLAEDIGNEYYWLTGENQENFKLKLVEYLYDMAMKQFTPEELKYLEMRKKSPNFLMRGGYYEKVCWETS